MFIDNELNAGQMKQFKCRTKFFTSSAFTSADPHLHPGSPRPSVRGQARLIERGNVGNGQLFVTRLFASPWP